MPTKKNNLGGHLIIEKLPGYFLIVCLLLVFAALIYLLSPFLTVIFVGAVLAIAFYPLHQKLLKFFRGWERSAAFVSCLLVVLVILAPLALFVLLLTSEAWDTYLIIDKRIASGVFDKYLQWADGGFLYDLKNQIQPIVDLESLDLKKNIVSMAQNLSGFLVTQTTSLALGVSNLLLKILVMLFTMFYFFKDGKKLVARFGDISPLPAAYENELFKKTGSMVKAIVYGVFLAAVLQGVVGGIGWAIAGMQSPVFWGTAIAFFSVVPIIGTAVIFIPAVIVLLIMGNYGTALFIAIWGAVAVGAVDNVVRPYLIGNRAHTYPLMTFLVVLGGVVTMGLKGVVIGPLILIVLMSFLHIYESEYNKVLKK